MISLMLKHRELEEEREIQTGRKEKDEKELWLSKKSKVCLDLPWFGRSSIEHLNEF